VGLFQNNPVWCNSSYLHNKGVDVASHKWHSFIGWKQQKKRYAVVSNFVLPGTPRKYIYSKLFTIVASPGPNWDLISKAMR
jgi:hypothetical protein